MTHQGRIAVERSNPAAADPMLPRPFRIELVKQELADTFTFTLRPLDGLGFSFQPGQINMLSAFGVGEVPISISGDPDDPLPLVHTIRAIGSVTKALGALRPGDMVGVRGPYGTPWPIEAAHGADVLIIGGGIGLAPLRPAILRVLAEREKFGNVVILYGARTPEDMLYADELRAWRSRFDINVRVTVDRSTGNWNGQVGVVTRLIKGGGFDRLDSVAFLCGPEIMMRYAVQTLREVGIGDDRVYLTLERNMKCGVGLCGHCQLGPVFVCRDGPVFRCDRVADLLMVREL